MDYAIAEAALEAGHDVVLVSGPVNLAPPGNVRFVASGTSDEMFEAVYRHAEESDVCVLCAAVADYKPATVSRTKIKKHADGTSLKLIPTRDILESLGQQRDRTFLLVGFAAETDQIEKNAWEKLRRKNCDIIVANDARIGMESDENELLILFRNGETKRLSRAPKTFLSRELVKIFLKFATKTFDKKNVMITERT